jgi:uncharacterized protein (TIGR03437 family)
LWFLVPSLLIAQVAPGFPFFSIDGVANAAANVSGWYAPNTLVSIYGVNLATPTVGLTAADVQNGALPTTLGSVRVLVNSQFADMFFVSPGQVNILIPTQMIAGPATIQLVNSGKASPAVRVDLGESAPGLFQLAGGFVIATHGNGPLVSPSVPAQRGEVVVIYATGLGPTSPSTPQDLLAATAAWIRRKAEFEVRLDGVAVAKNLVEYVGVTPGFGGLYQVNLRIPSNAPNDPEIRVGTPDRMSPAGTFLNIR